MWSDNSAAEADAMAAQLAKAKRNSGAPPPPRPLGRPDEAAGDAWWLTAFRRLSTCRAFYGDTPGPLPWSALRDYAADHQLPPTLRSVFFSVMEALDQKWRDHIHSLTPPLPPPPPSTAKRSGAGVRRLGR